MLQIFSRSNEEEFDYNDSNEHQDYSIDHQDYEYKDQSKTLDYDYKVQSKTKDYDYKVHSKTKDYDFKDYSEIQDYDQKDLNDIPTNMKILNQIKSSRIKKLENSFGRNDIIKDDSLEMNRRDVSEEQLGVDALEKHDPLHLVQIMALKRQIAVAKSHSTSNLDFRLNSQIFMIFIFILYT